MILSSSAMVFAQTGDEHQITYYDYRVDPWSYTDEKEWVVLGPEDLEYPVFSYTEGQKNEYLMTYISNTAEAHQCNLRAVRILGDAVAIHVQAIDRTRPFYTGINIALLVGKDSELSLDVILHVARLYLGLTIGSSHDRSEVCT